MKRKHSNSTEVAAVNGPPVKKQKKKFYEFSHDDLQCVVCWEKKLGPIFQCANSHLMCEHCHERLINAVKPCCPMCKEALNIMNPIRSRFVEKYLLTVETECTNSGCSEKLQFGQLKEHLESKCEFRNAKCKYGVFGCEWEGKYNQRKGHKKNCKIRKLKIPKTQLKALTEGAEKNVKQLEKASGERERGNEVVMKLLSTRANNVEVRDVMITAAGSYNDERMVSEDWKAAGSYFNARVEKVSNQETKLSVRLEMVGMRRKLNLHIVILPGPLFGVSFTPIVFKIAFSRRYNKSPLIVLPIPEEYAKSLIRLKEPINLRIIFVNLKHGLDCSFTSQRIHMDGDFSDSDDSSESDFRDSEPPRGIAPSTQDLINLMH